MKNLGIYNPNYKNEWRQFSQLDNLPSISFAGRLMELSMKWFRAQRDGKQDELRAQIEKELNELAALLWREHNLI